MISLVNRNVKVASLIERLSPDNQVILMHEHRQKKVLFLSDLLNQSEEVIINEIAKDFKLTFLKKFQIAQDIENFPLKLIHEYQCLPILPPDQEKNDEDKYIHLVTVWPVDSEMDRWVSIACGKSVIWYLTFPQMVSSAIIQRFGVGSNSLDESQLVDANFSESNASNEQDEDEDAAVIRFVNEIIAKGIQDRATDIHFEPQKNSLRIRYRIDGQLIPINLPSNLIKFQAAIISRLKIMSKLNISEKRRPQDGRIRFLSGPVEMDIRLSTLPTMYGESISLRLLNQGSNPITLQDLGLSKEDQKVVDVSIQKPHGIILVTGPTGSGKSTTLSACMRRIRGSAEDSSVAKSASSERRIITVEDPIEYEIDGINQSQVHSELGYTFASALRHILRQDPDVIMIGEIRDRETADIAIRASLTGHLVLSSLHTNDSPGALTRLVDMGIEPFLVASSVELIIAQRLVRRLCNFCKTPANLDSETVRIYLNKLGIDQSEAKYAKSIYKPVGCEQCRHLGFQGRIGLFEILKMNEHIHRLIIQKASAREIREQGMKDGMRTLQNSGWDQVKNGHTSFETVVKFAVVESED